MADLVGANGQRTEFRVVGQPNLPGKASMSLANGVAKFGIDYVLPGMLHAKFLRSPYANARVLKIDDTKARAIPGVVDIITWEDPELKMLGATPFGPPSRPYLDDYADQDGMEVGCIVIAEDEDIAEDALRALDVTWEVYPAMTDILKAKQPDAPIVRQKRYELRDMFSSIRPENQKGNVNFANTIQGDVDEGFKQADHIIEYEVDLPAFCGHIPNPPASVAWWTKEPYRDGEWLHIEGAVQRRNNIGQMYGVADDRTVQEGIFQGGKYCDWGMRMSQEITPFLAKRTGRPVRCAQTREETFDFLMNQRLIHMKIGFTKDGLITAIDDFSIADGGIQGSSGFGTANDQGYGPYYTTKCLNIRQRMEIIDSNTGKMFLSGQHCPFNWDTLTVGLHIMAEKLNRDVIELAKLNLHGPASQEDMTLVPSFEACIEAGKKLMNWKWHKSGAKTLPDGRKHGASFRYQICPRHAFSGYDCKLEYRGGKIHLPTQGPITGIFAVECNAMVVAEELNVEYDDVIVDYHWSHKFTPVGGGSDGTTASGWAMKECANILKRLVLEQAAKEAAVPPLPGMFGGPPAPNPLKGYSADELDIAPHPLAEPKPIDPPPPPSPFGAPPPVTGPVVYVKSDPSLFKALGSAVSQEIVATFSGRPPAAIWSLGMGKMLDTMNICFAEVAVDEDTGMVEILRFGVVADPGKVIRPTSLESQLDQVMFFSQGCQLLEEFIFDDRTGLRLNNNMIDYKKPTTLDVPRVDKDFAETRSGNAVYGASGISHSLANTHLVICAIENAIGAWVQPPATPDKVLKAIGKI
ncbi:MAG: molybdopterin-dependent oxidoreductase [Oscillospiraceae bacterium]|jgi:CO/xanthine dehydrogenase Mo-binding subunit|nr:molybdopterin-dependent oxidoreductase [Oscillospiraceae bacterium]